MSALPASDAQGLLERYEYLAEGLAEARAYHLVTLTLGPGEDVWDAEVAAWTAALDAWRVDVTMFNAANLETAIYF